MGYLLFFSSAISLYVLFYNDKKQAQTFWVAVIGGLLITGMGTFQVCSDGWGSPSIGKQGACSHHGGVTSQLNLFGWIALTLPLGILFYILKPEKNRNADPHD